MVVAGMNLLGDSSEKREEDQTSGHTRVRPPINRMKGRTRKGEMKVFKRFKYCFYRSKVVSYQQFIWLNLIED